MYGLENRKFIIFYKFKKKRGKIGYVPINLMRKMIFEGDFIKQIKSMHFFLYFPSQIDSSDLHHNKTENFSVVIGNIFRYVINDRYI